MGIRASDSITKPIIETKDKVNDDYAHYDSIPKPDTSTFRVGTPISINGNTFYGNYKVGQKLPMYRKVTKMEKVTRYRAEVKVDKDGNPMIGIDNNPITIEIPVTVEVPMVVSEQIVIDEEFKQNLLARTANARTQEERIYKNEGISLDVDAKTGNVKITRKM